MRKIAEIRRDLAAKVAETKGIQNSPENADALKKGVAEVKALMLELEQAETVEAAAQTLPRPPGAWDSPDAPRPPPRRPPGPGPGPGAGAGAGGGRAGSPGLGDRKLCGVNGKKWVVRALRLPLTSLPK